MRTYRRRARRGGRRLRLRRRVTKVGRVNYLTSRLSGVHRFKELAQLTSIAATAGASATGVITYQLTDLANVASFKNLFDLFKITGVKLRIVPQFNVSTGPGTAAVPSSPELLPMLYIAPNRDPFVGAPASVSDILNDDGCKIIRLNKPISMYLKNPKALILDTSPDGTLTTQASWQFNANNTALQPWLPSGGGGQAKDASAWKHFGHRWYIDNSQSTVQVTMLVYATYYFSMKEQD